MSIASERLSEQGSSELREYISTLRRHKWSIILITSLSIGISLFFSLRQTPLYQSHSRVLVTSSSLTGFPNMDTEQQVATSIPVAERAARQLASGESPESLLAGLRVESSGEAQVLVYLSTHPDPHVAQLRTAALAQAYLDYRRKTTTKTIVESTGAVKNEIEFVRSEIQDLNEAIANAESDGERIALEGQRTNLASQLAILEQELRRTTPSEDLTVGEILEPATLASAPTSPSHMQNAIFGTFFGLLAGLGFAFLRERLDDRLRGRGDLEACVGAPVLAVIPQIPGRTRGGKPLVTIEEPRSAASEAYRTLATSFLFATTQRGAKAILVTSAHAGDGKSQTAANLGTVLSQAGKRVILLSADLRRPSLHRLFGLNGEDGLTNVLTGSSTVKQVIHRTESPNLRLIPSGPMPGNPVELLGSDAMGRVLAELREVADYVLLDAPPVLGVADAITMAPLVDGVLFIADAQSSTRGSTHNAYIHLDQVDAVVIGAVLNNLDPASSPYSYYRYYGRLYEAGTETHADTKQKPRITSA